MVNVVQYWSDDDYPAADALATHLHWELKKTGDASDLIPYKKWVLVGAQEANPVFAAMTPRYFRDVTSEDEGYVFIQHKAAAPETWAVSGATLKDTIDAVKWIKENGLPDRTIHEKYAPPAPPAVPEWLRGIMNYFGEAVRDKWKEYVERHKAVKPGIGGLLWEAFQFARDITGLSMNVHPAVIPDVPSIDAWSKLITGESIFVDETGEMNLSDWIGVLGDILILSGPALSKLANKFIAARQGSKLVKLADKAAEQRLALEKAGYTGAQAEKMADVFFRELVSSGVKGGKWKWLASIAATISSTHGLGTFMTFIGEEFLQTTGLSVYTAISNKQWDAAKAALKEHREMIERYNDILNSWGIVSPLTRDVFVAYRDAAAMQADYYEEVIARQGTPGKLPRIYKKGDIEKTLAAGVVPSVDELTVVPPEPEEIIPEMPGWAKDKIRNFRDTLESRMFTAKSAVEAYDSSPTAEGKDRADTALSEFEAAIDELEAWVEDNREALEDYQKLEELQTNIETARSQAKGFADDIAAIEKREAEKPPEIPFEVSEAIRIKKSDIDNAYWSAKDYITAKDYGSAKAVIENARSMIADFRSYIEERKAELEPAHLYSANIGWADSQKTRFDALEALAAPPEERPPEAEEKGKLILYISPPGAEVYEGPLMLGSADDTGLFKADMDSGIHKITVKLAGYIPQDLTVMIEEGKETERGISLEAEVPKRKLYEVAFSAVDPMGGALHPKVFVNDWPTGKWAPDTILLEPGTWTFKFELSGYETAEQTIELPEFTEE